MKEYNFTIQLILDQDIENEDVVELLLENGCEDSTIAMGQPGYLYLDFDRISTCRENAINSARSDIKKAIPNSHILQII